MKFKNLFPGGWRCDEIDRVKNLVAVKTENGIEIEIYALGWQKVETPEQAENICITGGQKFRNLIERHAPELLEKKQ